MALPTRSQLLLEKWIRNSAGNVHESAPLLFHGRLDFLNFILFFFTLPYVYTDSGVGWLLHLLVRF